MDTEKHGFKLPGRSANPAKKPFSASDGEKVAKPDEVFPGSGEGLGVRALGEVLQTTNSFNR
jgi:hypothetical protein